MTRTLPHGRSSGCADRVDLWRLDLDQPMPPEALAVLSEDERRRAESLPDAGRRRRWQAGRAGLRRILGSYLDRAPQDIAFDYAGRGKPVLTGSYDVHFNLAHAGRHALVAVARRRPVGVDLELARPLTDITDLARSLLPPALADRLASLGPAAGAARLLTCWARLEAIGKLAGSGVAGGLAALAQPDGAGLTGAGAHRGPLGDAWLEDIDAGPGLVAAIAVGGAAAVDIVWCEPVARTSVLR